MTISVGDRVPAVALKRLTAEGVQEVAAEDLFDGKLVVLFGLPGAFTRTCSANHLPGFVRAADALKAKGVDSIGCVSVNDAFVMDAWGKDRGVGDRVLMLADGSGEFTAAIGLTQDMSARGFGVRSRRYAMIVEDRVVKSLEVETGRGVVGVSGADAVLAKL